MKLSLDSPIVDKTNQIADIIILGFLWLLTSIPIITMGPASIALYYAVVKSVRKKHDTAVKAFFHSFKENFKQGIIATLLYFGYGCIIIYYVTLSRNHLIFQENIYLTVVMGIVIISPFVFTVLYIFPIISRFENKLVKQIFYAIHMAVGNIFSTGIMFAVLFITCFFIYLFPFFIIIFPGFLAYFSSLFIEKIFKKYTKQLKNQYIAQDVLPWYLD